MLVRRTRACPEDRRPRAGPSLSYGQLLLSEPRLCTSGLRALIALPRDGRTGIRLLLLMGLQRVKSPRQGAHSSSPFPRRLPRVVPPTPQCRPLAAHLPPLDPRPRSRLIPPRLAPEEPFLARISVPPLGIQCAQSQTSAALQLREALQADPPAGSPTLRGQEGATRPHPLSHLLLLELLPFLPAPALPPLSPFLDLSLETITSPQGFFVRQLHHQAEAVAASGLKKTK